MCTVLSEKYAQDNSKRNYIHKCKLKILQKKKLTLYNMQYILASVTKSNELFEQNN